MNLFDILAGIGGMNSYLTIGAYILTVFGLAVWFTSRPQNDEDPPAFPDFPIPGLLNGYRYLFRTDEFLKRAKELVNEKRRIMSFWLGPQRVYLVTGSKNVQAVLRNSGCLDSEELVLRVLPQLDGVTSKDLQLYKDDRSGRGRVPLDGTPENDRIWGPNHRIMVDHLSSASATISMTGKFCELFVQRLDSRAQGEWETINTELVEAAIISLAGTKLLELNPDFADAMWNFDASVYPLVFGVPRIFFRQGYRNRDRFHEMGEKWLEYAFARYDFDGPDEDWDELFGARFMRVHAKFLKDKGLDRRSRSGMALGTVWAQNANAAPIIAWSLFEIFHDQSLFQAVRKEALTAFDEDPVSGERILNRERLMQLPLLSSIYAESLRLHVSVNITRSVQADMKLDGYYLKKGALVQSPSILGHMEDEHWSQAGHPADQFWAERFIIYEEEKDSLGQVKSVPKFSTAGHAGNWFPYGGGISICAGRHFAKQEIMAAVALIVVKFEVEFLEYVHLDGSQSDRAPKDDPWWVGTAATPPDRDMKIRWRRL